MMNFKYVGFDNSMIKSLFDSKLIKEPKTLKPLINTNNLYLMKQEQIEKLIKELCEKQVDYRSYEWIK